MRTIRDDVVSQRPIRSLPTRHGALLAVFVGVAVGLASSQVAANESGDERWNQIFETKVRPLLSEHCHKCHGSKRQSGGLRLDSRAGALEGGESGAAIKPGEIDGSLLVQAIRHQGGLEMPPDGPLTKRQQDLLEDWIRNGAVWPESDVPPASDIQSRSRQHWAFQTIERPKLPPAGSDADPISGKNPIDLFVAVKRKASGLAGAPPADPSTLLRRASYTLTGLPPSLEDAQRFAAWDKSASPEVVDAAYREAVDRMLESSAFGEHWARHWLDVARYSDTKGYVYAREERRWVHAWAYRDWVARAFQEDLPYDRFLTLQLAADQVADRRDGDLAAMGFLTIGRRFLGVKHDIIDDRIDVVCRGAMGLTVSCARCHDHKFDAIPTADYYSLYGVFASCVEVHHPLPDKSSESDEKFQAELTKRRTALAEKLAAARLETANRIRKRVQDYLTAQTELEKYPPPGFDQVFEADDMLPAFVRHWQKWLLASKRNNEPVFAIWHPLYNANANADADANADANANPAAGDGSNSPQAWEQLVRATIEQKKTVSHPLVWKRFADNPPRTFADVVGIYGALFNETEQRFQQARKEGKAELSDPHWESLRQILYAPDSPCEVPDEPIVNSERFFRTADITALWKLQGECDRWINQSSYAPVTVALIDRDTPSEPRIFRRGNPLQLGEQVPRRFLQLLSGGASTPFQNGSGRLELARAIASPDNPLTARVIVNRIWAHHFGQGLVEHQSDFGLRSPPPSHPQLLDFLASKLIDDGWRLKPLHRLIVTSQTFRQSSRGPTDSAAARQAMEVDPLNRLLWRMNPKRMTFEQLRDSILSVSGDLDRRVGGKPVDILRPPFPPRRTIYGIVDRQFLPSTLRVFDFASPDLHVASRSETTVPQQALFFLNHPWVLEQAKKLAAAAFVDADVRLDRSRSGDDQRWGGLSKHEAELAVQSLFRRVHQRSPDKHEMTEAMQLVANAKRKKSSSGRDVKTWSYGLGRMNEANGRIDGFRELPYFSGDAWQGGPAWPDAKLGWTQLTATGGHPGNTREHACIRRWTAPRDMTVDIASKFSHEAAPGDGVRVFVVLTTPAADADVPERVLASEKLHQATKDIQATSLKVHAGDAVDFVVDIDKVLNSDQFLWDITIAEQASGKSGKPPLTWNSKADFPADETRHLSGWQQLAHVLICSNELMFVD